MLLKLNAEQTLNTEDILYIKRFVLENYSGPDRVILRITTNSGSEIDFEHNPPFLDIYNLERKIKSALTH